MLLVPWSMEPMRGEDGPASIKASAVTDVLHSNFDLALIFIHEIVFMSRDEMF